MPVTEAIYRCTHCHDEFAAKSGSFTKCNCGKSEIEPSQFGYSYKQGSDVETVEHGSYYLEEEFVKLPEDIQEIYDQIKLIKKNNDYKYYFFELTEKGKNGETYISQINISHYDWVSTYASEKNEIKFTLRLKKDEYRGHDVTKQRLSRFLQLMKDIESGEVKISNRSELIKMADSENIDYSEEPTGETNYTFYI